MSNPLNTGTLVGRLARDPKIWENKDGSKKVAFTVYADRNYTNSAGQRDSDDIDVEAFISARVEGVGPYANIHQGDLVALSYTLRKDRFEKDGQMRYELKVEVQNITFMEPRSVTQARLEARQNKASAGAGAAAADGTIEVPAVAGVLVDDKPFAG